VGYVGMKKKGSYARNASLIVRLDAVYAVTGVQVPLRGETSARGQKGCVDYDCLFLLIVGPWVKGDDATIPKGTKVQASVARDVAFERSELKKVLDETGKADTARRAARAGEATILVYRVADGMRGKPEVFLDEKSVARMAERSFVSLRVGPGRHLLAAGKTEIEFPLIGGEEYYVRVSKAGTFGKVKLDLVSAEQGEDESFLLIPDR